MKVNTVIPCYHDHVPVCNVRLLLDTCLGELCLFLAEHLDPPTVPSRRRRLFTAEQV